MKFASEIFRENDIRALADTQLPDEAVYAIGRAYATLLTEAGGKAAAVGRDVRPSSPRISCTFVRALRDGGIHVVDIGEVTTPVVYFAGHTLEVDGTAMITASHNPGEYNGFKLGIFRSSLHGDKIRRILDIASTGRWSSGQGGIRRHDCVTDYRAWFRSHFSFARKLKVAYDPANGAGAIFGHELLRELGFEVVELFCAVDGTFPNHHPDPTVEKNLADLRRTVVEHQCDLGIGIDGDGDRLGVVDDCGNWIQGDLLTLVLARPILVKRPGAPIIFEVKSSRALVDGISEAGGIPVMWKVGHSLIKQKMKELDAPLAGEVSGHVFFADRYFGFDDAMYATCRLLELVACDGRKLSEIASDIPRYPSTPELRVSCSDDAEKFRIARAFAESFRSEHQTIDIDGVRIVFPDGWALVRASNTQPDLVLRFEADTADRVEQLRAMVLDRLRAIGNVQLGGH